MRKVSLATDVEKHASAVRVIPAEYTGSIHLYQSPIENPIPLWACANGFSQVNPRGEMRPARQAAGPSNETRRPNDITGF